MRTPGEPWIERFCATTRRVAELRPNRTADERSPVHITRDLPPNLVKVKAGLLRRLNHLLFGASTTVRCFAVTRSDFVLIALARASVNRTRFVPSATELR